MKVWQLSTLAVFMLGLSACGSSGGKDYAIGAGSELPSSNGSINRSVSNNSSSGNSSSGGSGSSSSGSSGGSANNSTTQPDTIAVLGYTVNMDVTAPSKPLSSGNVFSSLRHNKEQKSINTIVLDGKTINLLSTAGIPQAQIYKDLSNARWGYLHIADDNIYFISQGTETPEDKMPKTGSYTYRGNALYVNTSNPNKVARGIVEMKASFADKRISGTVSSVNSQHKEFDDIELDGAITNGARFIGTANFVGAQPSEKPNEMSGAFYGNKANEISGVFFNEEKGFAGSFGAKR